MLLGQLPTSPEARMVWWQELFRIVAPPPLVEVERLSSVTGSHSLARWEECTGKVILPAPDWKERKNFYPV